MGFQGKEGDKEEEEENEDDVADGNVTASNTDKKSAFGGEVALVVDVGVVSMVE